MVDTIPEGILTMKGCATNVKELDTQQEIVEDAAMVVVSIATKKVINKPNVQQKNQKKVTMKVEVMAMIRLMLLRVQQVD